MIRIIFYTLFGGFVGLCLSFIFSGNTHILNLFGSDGLQFLFICTELGIAVGFIIGLITRDHQK
jgi:hypothetical protein